GAERGVDHPVLNLLGEGGLRLGPGDDHVARFVLAPLLQRLDQALVEAVTVAEVPTGEDVADELALPLDPVVEPRGGAHQGGKVRGGPGVWAIRRDMCARPIGCIMRNATAFWTKISEISLPNSGSSWSIWLSAAF